MACPGRVYYDKESGLFVVPDGACPYPIGDDDGSAKQCIERGRCGCDERDKPHKDLDP